MKNSKPDTLRKAAAPKQQRVNSYVEKVLGKKMENGNACD